MKSKSRFLVSDILNLTPEKKWDIGDARPNGSKLDFAKWSTGYCDDYDADTELQMEKTISKLLDKKEKLIYHKNKLVIPQMKEFMQICKNMSKLPT